jgi:adenosylcobinamide-GDP ribazoletransferase
MLTIAPVRVDRVDRQAGGAAMALAPAVGALLGAVLGAAGLAAMAAGAAPVLAAAVVVALDTILTRGLHLDGLADTTDALGSYRDRQGALDIMKKSDIGPFGVAAIVLVLLLRVSALSGVLDRSPVAAVAAMAATAAAGRVAVTIACRRGVPAARENGLGVMVAGTVTLSTAVIARSGSACPARRCRRDLAGLLAVGWRSAPHRPGPAGRPQAGGVTGTCSAR